jgi:hypothetical protein
MRRGCGREADAFRDLRATGLRASGFRSCARRARIDPGSRGRRAGVRRREVHERMGHGVAVASDLARLGRTRAAPGRSTGLHARGCAPPAVARSECPGHAEARPGCRRATRRRRRAQGGLDLERAARYRARLLAWRRLRRRRDDVETLGDRGIVGRPRRPGRGALVRAFPRRNGITTGRRGRGNPTRYTFRTTYT